MLDFGREVCGHLAIASQKEWLVTNGIGGFGMGTVAGVLTRRYHGLLIAALQPPLGRTLMLTKLDEMIEYDGQYTPLYVNRWFGDEDDGRRLEEPHGHYHLERFRLEGTTPHWTYAIGDALLEKRVWMEQGQNTTYIHYTLLRASNPLKLYPKAFINYRDYHQTTIASDWEPDVEIVPNGLCITARTGATPLYLLSDRGEIYPQEEWYEDFFLAVEEYRGQRDVVEDHLHIADFAITLQPGETVTLVASTKPNPQLNGQEAYKRQVAHEQALIAQAEQVQGPLVDEARRQLVLAADQFVVRRATPNDPHGRSIIAGYPWFSDWGRDTMISLPGIAICNGRTDVSASILRTYAHYVNQGMIPNRFPDVGEEPEYNTADATLWYFQALRTHHEATQDLALLGELYPTLAEIIRWHEQGTRYGIGMDSQDGLLRAGTAGWQLTWMDAKVDDWVVTPRIGKPVEINALWYNALRCMAYFAEQLGQDGRPYAARADQVQASFGRFWHSAVGYCYDVLDGPEGHESKLRPNQLLAVSLSYSPLTAEQQKGVVDVCARKLLTSHGLRSLAADDPAYLGAYGGDQKKRDGAYHQGTVWGWLMGPFTAAHLRVYKNPALAQSYLEPALRHLADHGLGSMSEIFDGDPPFKPRGCPAQAWSVGEYLRAWCMIRKASGEGL